MRLPMLLLACAAMSIAAAHAQDAPPAEAAKAEPGLSDLSDTVENLQDEPPAEASDEPPVEAALEAQGEVAAEPPSEAPAEAGEPAAEAPAQAEAETPAPVPAGPRFVEPLSRAQLEQLAAASARGRLLGVIAAAGQIATADMLGRVSDPEAAGISGWIAEPAGNGVTVTFYAAPEGGAAPAVVYRANVLGTRVVSRDIYLAPESRPALNATQARMAAARSIAAEQDHRPCGGDQFNYLVVPPAGADAPVDVYQISPQTARGRFPVGGHFKTVVAADGSVAESRGYAGNCLDLEVPELAAGARPEPLAITHTMDPLPTEIHAFLSVWTGRPLVVVAGDPQRLIGVTPQGMGELPDSAQTR